MRTAPRTALAAALSTVLVTGLLTGLLATQWVGAPAVAHEGHEHPALDSPARSAPELPDRFRDETVIGGLTEPTSVDFAPDGTAFVTQKSGAVFTFEQQPDGTYDDPEPGQFVDLRTEVHNYYDRGLLGLAVDPAFPERPYVYVVYSWDRDPREPGRVPRWGDPDGYYDECPVPTGESEDEGGEGCVVSARLSRLTAQQTERGWEMAPDGEKPLVDAYCLQFPSHAAGSVHVGPDGYLYATVGEGASFDFADRGQVGNPCGDPVDEGGSMRSQDLLTTGDPVGLNGTVIRVDPDTGAPAPGNPTHPQGPVASSAIATGLRNPFRFTFRPGAGERPELWVGDVGGNGFEEVDRVLDASAVGDTATNFGWPCFEGPRRNPEFAALDLPVCEGLYRDGGVADPFFSYRTRGDALTSDDGCASGTASISGVQFLSRSAYPTRYAGALAFSDFSRGCVFVLLPGADGLPDPDRVEPLVQGARSPVDLTTGPDGDLYYVSYGTDDRGFPLPGNGSVRRVHHYAGNLPPTGLLDVVGDPFGPVPLEVALDASGSSDEDGEDLRFEWDLDGDGLFDDATGATASRTYTDSSTNVLVGVRVTDDDGAADTVQQWLYPGNTPPVLDVDVSAETFAVGDYVEMAATAEDAEDGGYGARPDRFSWTVTVRHCPSVCHTHPFTTFQYAPDAGVVAPDHEYPSTLLLTASVIDDRNMTVYESVELEPRPSELVLRSRPRGVRIKATGHVGAGRYTYIEGGTFTVSAPARQKRRGKVWRFDRWSDGGARTHEVVAVAGGQKLVAVYKKARKKDEKRGRG